MQNFKENSVMIWCLVLVVCVAYLLIPCLIEKKKGLQF